MADKEKVTVVTQPGEKPVVFRGDNARDKGASTAHKRLSSPSPLDKKQLGRFVERQSSGAQVGGLRPISVDEVEVQD